eukprot:CAMPEP_0170364708 /NCGR_PEP_ID=MMETSP0117_2-20130122/5519_1 /TAXON_ID=400756 /ORGANISM="Durinskia baltica, Strain CSIRO CS-38" /LENGTH=77 /DNA_ID=CAMNT_0010619229 /DNA_START=147 /DNA_END=380 /DNA_ORIENTATION=+
MANTNVFQFRSFITTSSQPSLSIQGILAKRVIQIRRVQPVYSREMSSVMKKRRSKMNKHKLKKRRKALRMNTKASRA